jgi:hypothetical protein
MLKKNSLYLFALLLLSNSLLAQLVSITDDNSKLVNGDTVYVNGTTANGTLSVGFKVTNTSGSDKTFNVRRYETSLVAGSKNYFCFGMCFTDLITGTTPFSNAGSKITIPSNDYTTGFRAYHSPKGNAGLSKYRYVIFDVNNTSDSVFVNVFFDISAPNGIEKNAIQNTPFYVNASRQLILQNNASLNASSYNLRIFNVLAQQNYESIISASQLNGFDLSFLGSGMYLLSLQNDNEVLYQQKIVIE